ncbi:NAD(P)H-dependent flavin oxidoreductase [Paramicrobacterium agarici]|uniref:Nitronate monooxygenase n=1 Tax=Paramicrobacterium agarici TaxID=630514 RepID=A0A2A9DYR6_9MICO|nr:nitronate monooxygenase [Microbacterium agarici]PFG31079.1 nitronate monooxygenase [Microbacterium agarici]
MMNALTELLTTRTVPVFNASMAGAAGPDLASAVSGGGGVGMLGVPSAPDLDGLTSAAERLQRERAVWGAGFLSFALDADITPLQRVLDHEPSVVALGFGHSDAAVTAVRKSPAVLLAQVGNIAELESAIDAGVDGIIVRGAEAGGHGRNEISTLTFLQIAVERTSIPLLAAGGITTARGLAAVIAGGAIAAWVGTRFTVASESQFPDAAKQRVLDARDGDTVYTRVFDIAQRAAWPPHYGGRALSNSFSDTWHGREHELETTVRSSPSMADDMLSARREGRFDVGPIYSGEGSALVTRVESAEAILADLGRYRDYLHAAR